MDRFFQNKYRSCANAWHPLITDKQIAKNRDKLKCQMGEKCRSSIDILTSWMIMKNMGPEMTMEK